MVTESETRDEAGAAERPARQRNNWVLAPVAIFALLAILFAFALTTGDPSKLPSALIGKPAPQSVYRPVSGLTYAGRPVDGFSTADLGNGKVSVVNFWASWCGPCVEEHAHLTDLVKTSGVDLYGVNYKDTEDAARRFITLHGNPYKAIGIDPQGRAAIEWGVYGMPETFVVDGDGRIAFKHVGPVSARSLQEQLLPAIEKARAQKPAAASKS